jgi:hypothetical protein
MTTGVTYRNWKGRPALTQDGQVRAMKARLGDWLGADEADGIDWRTVMAEAASIGEGHFSDMFADWGMKDLEGWYQRRDVARPYDSYAKARIWAAR